MVTHESLQWYKSDSVSGCEPFSRFPSSSPESWLHVHPGFSHTYHSCGFMCYMEVEMCSPWKGKTDVESMGTLAPEIKRGCQQTVPVGKERKRRR